jgi:hypothetical protein
MVSLVLITQSVVRGPGLVGTHWKCSISGSSPQILNWNLHLSRILREFVCIFEVNRHWAGSHSTSSSCFSNLSQWSGLGTPDIPTLGLFHSYTRCQHSPGPLITTIESKKSPVSPKRPLDPILVGPKLSNRGSHQSPNPLGVHHNRTSSIPSLLCTCPNFTQCSNVSTFLLWSSWAMGSSYANNCSLPWICPSPCHPNWSLFQTTLSPALLSRAVVSLIHF